VSIYSITLTPCIVKKRSYFSYTTNTKILHLYIHIYFDIISLTKKKEDDFMKKQYIIVLLLFLYTFITNLYQPVMPYFVESRQLSGSMYGFFIAAVSFGSMLGAPFWGNLFDKDKKKFALISGVILYAIFQVIFAISTNSFIMLITRFISGFGIITINTVLYSEINYITTKKDRGKFITLSSVASTLGISLGYFLGGSMTQWKFLVAKFGDNIFQVIIIIQALLTLFLAIIYFIFFNPEESEEKNIINKRSLKDRINSLKAYSIEFILFLIAFTLITAATMSTTKYIDVYFKDLGYGANILGRYHMIIGIVSLVSGLLFIPIIKNIQNKTMFIVLLQFLNIIVIFISFRSSNFLLMAYTFLILFAISKVFFTPVELQHISSYANNNNYGEIIGIRSSFLSLGNILGPLLGAIFYSKSSTTLFDINIVIFSISIVLLILGYYIIYIKQKIMKRGKKNELGKINCEGI